MTVTSMTGFARMTGEAGPLSWTWEAKSVNAKGLDVRLRLPLGFDGLEQRARAALGRKISRGTCYATLSVQRAAPPSEVRVNVAAARAIIEAARQFAADHALTSELSLDRLFALRGVVDVIETTEGEEARMAIEAGLIAGLEATLDRLVAARQAEGAELALALNERVATIERLVAAADAAPGRKPEAIKARLSRLLAEISERTDRLDENRLYQEALLMAAKADVREELDRLAVHVRSARALLESAGSIGRRLDFVAQELSREANTLCAKSNDPTLTTIGLEMRVEIEQFREQAQNVE